jgi:hypothetical protein
MKVPKWGDCKRAVRMGAATALQQFVYDNEPNAPDDRVWREQLQDVLDEVANDALDA